MAGCTLYYMIYGCPAFLESSEVRLFKKIKSGDYNIEEGKCSKQAESLVKALIEVDVDKRLSIEAALAHPFFTQDV